jgi:flagellar protein FliS
MPHDLTSVYLASEAATVPRLKLLRMVYDGAIGALEGSLVKLERGDRAAFVKGVSKAQDLVAELQKALDHEQGGEIARSLERLYDWMQRSLTPACIRGDRAAIEHVIQLLTTLKAGWDGVRDDAVEDATFQTA